MEKYVRFSSVDSLGRHFAESIDITPRGGGLEKIAGARHPEVEEYIRCLRPDPAYQYVLMTPMGAFEAYGMNSNGDKKQSHVIVTRPGAVIELRLP